MNYILILLIPFLMFFNASQSEGGTTPVQYSNLQSIVQDSANADELYIGYNYWFAGGISEEISIFGNGKMYYYKSVHTQEYQDGINAAYASGKRISPYQWSLANCEYGDYDIYRQADLTPDQVQMIVQAVADSDVLTMQNEHGDNSYHGLRILLPGHETLKTAALLDHVPQLKQITSYLVSDLKESVNMVECSKTEFSNAMHVSIRRANLVEVFE